MKRKLNSHNEINPKAIQGTKPIKNSKRCFVSFFPRRAPVNPRLLSCANVFHKMIANSAKRRAFHFAFIFSASLFCVEFVFSGKLIKVNCVGMHAENPSANTHFAFIFPQALISARSALHSRFNCSALDRPDGSK